MKKCPYCSAEILDDAEFCLYCMRQLSDKTAVKNKTLKPYWPFALIGTLLALLTCAIILLILNGGNNTPSGHSSINKNSTMILSSLNPPTSEENIEINSENISGENQTFNNNSVEASTPHTNKNDFDSAHTESTTNENSSTTDDGKTDDPPSSPIIDNSSNGERVDESSSEQASSTPTPSKKEEPTKPTWEVKAVDGGVEITGIENYNATGSYEVPSQIDGKTVIGIGLQAFYYEQDLKSITLPDTLKYIDEQAFANCNSLTEIIIPANVTEIKSNAFMSCRQLTRVYIKSGKVTIANYAFSNSYQRNVTLTIYAPSSVMDKFTALSYDAEYVEWNG